MGGSTKTQGSSSNQIDPSQFAQYQKNYQAAQGNAGILNPITGQPVTPGTPGANAPLGSAQLTQATNATSGILGSSPGSLATTDLSPYMNPYTTDVVNQTINQNERARQIAQTNDSQQATAAGAFGGSRSGILGAQTNEAFDRNTGAQIASLNQANYSQAQNAAQQDIQTKLANGTLQLNAAGQLVDESGQVIAHAGQIQGILNSGLGMMPVQQTVSTTGKQSTNPGLAGILGSVGSIASAFA